MTFRNLNTLLLVTIISSICFSCTKPDDIDNKIVFELSEKILETGASGGKVTVEIKSSIEYEVRPVYQYDWITFEQPDSLYNGPIEFNIAPNDQENGRAGHIEFFSQKSGWSLVLEIRQGQIGSDGRYEHPFALLESYADPIDTDELLNRVDPYSSTGIFNPRWTDYRCVHMYYSPIYDDLKPMNDNTIKLNKEICHTETIVPSIQDGDDTFSTRLSFDLPLDMPYDFSETDMNYVESMDLIYNMYPEIVIGDNDFYYTVDITFTLPETAKVDSFRFPEWNGGNIFKGECMSWGFNHMSFAWQMYHDSIGADISVNDIVNITENIHVDVDLTIHPTQTASGVVFMDSYPLSLSIMTYGTVKETTCKIDEPATYEFPEDFICKFTLPSSLTSSESNPVLHDFLYDFCLYDGGYSFLYDRSLSGRFVTYKDERQVKEMPFGEEYGKTPVIIPAGASLYNIDFTEKGLLPSKLKNWVYIEGMSELLVGNPDKLVLQDIVIHKNVDKLVKMIPGGDKIRWNKYITTGVEFPLLLGEGFKATRTLKIDLYPTFFKEMTSLPTTFDLVIDLENTFPVDVTILENSAYHVSLEYSSDPTPVVNESVFIKGATETSHERVRLTCRLDDVDLKTECIQINIPVIFTVNQDCVGKMIYDDAALKMTGLAFVY